MKTRQTLIEIAQHRLRDAADGVMLAELSRPTMQDWHAGQVHQLLRRAAKAVKEAGAVLPRPRPLFHNGKVAIRVCPEGALKVGKLALSTRRAAALLAYWEAQSVARYA